MELLKAVVMFRKILATEPVPLLVARNEKKASKPRHISSVQALIAVASVCRYWSQMFATCRSSVQRQLKRSLNC
jgi:ribosome biogenesis protein Tsr3